MEDCRSCFGLLTLIAILVNLIVYISLSDNSITILAVPQHEQPQYRKILQCPFGREYLQSFPDQLPRVSASRRRIYVEAPWGAPIVWSFTVDINTTARIQSGPFSVGLVVAAIGTYIVFLKHLIGTADQWFMNSQNVTYFVFTDNPVKVSKVNSKRTIVVLEEKDRGWPHNSMLRFAMIQSYRDKFQDMDFLFCIDVDIRFYDEVDAEALEYRVGTLHPMHYEKRRITLPYDTNPLSTAYVNASEGSYYYSGAFFGGCRDEIYHMSDVIQANILRDSSCGNYTARWHDESHLNRYFIDHPPTKLLSPEYYCFRSLCDLMPSVRIKSPESSVKIKLKSALLVKDLSSE